MTVARIRSQALLIAILILVGAFVAWKPIVAIVALAGVCFATWIAWRRSMFWWDILLVVLGGTVILGYGFANLGIPGRLPLPLTDLILLLLLVRIVFSGGIERLQKPAPFVIGALLLAFATIRLFVDYPLWGSNAFRDYVLPLEICFLLVGYWSLGEYGVKRWILALNVLFGIAAAYMLLYPLRKQIESMSPLVGLQHPVPLFGDYSHGGPIAASGFLFAALLARSKPIRVGLCASFLIELGLYQSRGVYIALPLACLVVILVSRGIPHVRRDVLGAIAASGVLAVMLFMCFPMTGRLGGRVSVNYITAQILTLTGQSGPGAGSIDTRKQFIKDTLSRINSTNNGWLWGVGLGPDLAGGFTTGPASPKVRKPHDDYLEMYARCGVIGVSLFVSMLLIALARIASACRVARGSVEGRFLIWVLASAVVFLVIAATQPLLAFPYGTVPLFTTLGAGLALAAQQKSRQDE